MVNGINWCNVLVYLHVKVSTMQGQRDHNVYIAISQQGNMDLLWLQRHFPSLKPDEKPFLLPTGNYFVRESSSINCLFLIIVYNDLVNNIFIMFPMRKKKTHVSNGKKYIRYSSWNWLNWKTFDCVLFKTIQRIQDVWFYFLFS